MNIHQANNKTLIWLQAAIFIFPLLIYSNTIGHDYALDDAMVITRNEYTQKGFSGLKDIFTQDSFKGYFQERKVNLPGGRYRPLSIATFAVEHALFGLNPHISHLINILLYAFTGIVLFRALRLLFRDMNESPAIFSIPVLATFLFLAHPIHTEVVANIKGRDEILSLFFAMLALISAVKYADNKQWTRLLLSFILLFLALLAKENAITFVLLIPLSVFFFRDITFKWLLALTVPAIVAASVYVLIRNAATGGFQVQAAGELMNNPFLNASTDQKFATVVYTLGIYLKLLFWPHPLTFDYYPYHIALTGWQNIGVAFTLAVYIALILYAVVTIRNKKPAAYSILFFMISLLMVSNLFINMGTFMNERFVYQASVGFVTGVSGFLLCIMDNNVFRKILKNQTVRGLIFLVIILAFSVLTFARNFAWKDDFTLFLTDVKTSSNSAKSNCGAGGVLLERAVASQDANQKKKYFEQSLPYLIRATVIDSTYSDVWRKLGTVTYELNHDIPAALQYYFRAVSINAGDELAYTNIHFILAESDPIDWKISMYEKLLKINPVRSDIHAQLGLLYGREKKNYPASIAYFKNAVKLDPAYKEAYKGLGVAYQMMGEYGESLRWLESALKLDTQDPSVYRLMGKSAQLMGDSAKANDYNSRAVLLKGRNRN